MVLATAVTSKLLFFKKGVCLRGCGCFPRSQTTDCYQCVWSVLSTARPTEQVVRYTTFLALLRRLYYKTDQIDAKGRGREQLQLRCLLCHKCVYFFKTNEHIVAMPNASLSGTVRRSLFNLELANKVKKTTL